MSVCTSKGIRKFLRHEADRRGLGSIQVFGDVRKPFISCHRGYLVRLDHMRLPAGFLKSQTSDEALEVSLQVPVDLTAVPDCFKASGILLSRSDCQEGVDSTAINEENCDSSGALVATGAAERHVSAAAGHGLWLQAPFYSFFAVSEPGRTRELGRPCGECDGRSGERRTVQQKRVYKGAAYET